MSTKLSQQAFYQRILKNHLFDDIDHAPSYDWHLLDTIDGIKYYYPSNKSWGSIIAVSNDYMLATHTGFDDIDYMTSPDSDHKQVVSNGVIMCKFEAGE